jgi:hypothetical protein
VIAYAERVGAVMPRPRLRSLVVWFISGIILKLGSALGMDLVK